MIYWIYTFLAYLLQPFILLEMFRRSLKQKAYRRRLCERYAFYVSKSNPQPKPKPKPNGIIVHAASVGEVIAITPLVKTLQRFYPNLPITLTTVTPTGSERVKVAFGDSVSHFYLPYDLPDAVSRFLNHTQPKAIIVVETELWPTLIRVANKRKIPFIIANARLSLRSAKRYGMIKKYLQPMLNGISLIMSQDKVSADRYLELGIKPRRLVNTGNLKFDLEVSEKLTQKVERVKAKLNMSHRPIWVAGSTHEGEDKLLLEAHQNLLKTYPDLLLILVPRHPERFNSVAELIEKEQMTFIRRSEKQPLTDNITVLLGDTMGEMLLFYGLSQIAFVGGSLVKHGGHNPLEPIAFKLPVISGRYTYNFTEIFSKLKSVNGVVKIESNVEELEQAVRSLLENANYRQQIGEAGYQVLKENQGALQRHLDLLKPYLEK